MSYLTRKTIRLSLSRRRGGRDDINIRDARVHANWKKFTYIGTAIFRDENPRRCNLTCKCRSFDHHWTNAIVYQWAEIAERDILGFRDKFIYNMSCVLYFRPFMGCLMFRPCISEIQACIIAKLPFVFFHKS
jgi:hypothetical protein